MLNRPFLANIHWFFSHNLICVIQCEQRKQTMTIKMCYRKVHDCCQCISKYAVRPLSIRSFKGFSFSGTAPCHHCHRRNHAVYIYSFISFEPWNVRLRLYVDCTAAQQEHQCGRWTTEHVETNKRRAKYWSEEVSDYFSISRALHYFIYLHTMFCFWVALKNRGSSSSKTLTPATARRLPLSSRLTSWQPLPCHEILQPD